MDCIAVKLYGVDTVGADHGYINIEDDKDAIMKLFKQCGGPDNYEFYVINNLIGADVDILVHPRWTITISRHLNVIGKHIPTISTLVGR